MGSLTYLVMVLVGWSFLPVGDCNAIQSVEWLLGEWRAESDERVFRESWRQVSTHTYEGSGASRDSASGEVVFTESLRLVEMSGEVFYLAKVDHNDLPVAFKLTVCDPGYAVFENSDHDFPKRLEYRRSPDDQMVVSVSDGEDRSFELHFRRQADGD